jgi:hypothetical protein
MANFPIRELKKIKPKGVPNATIKPDEGPGADSP